MDGKTPGECTPDEITEIRKMDLNEKEKKFLRYPPKATVERDLDIKVFNCDCQQMRCKIRWEERRIREY